MRSARSGSGRSRAVLAGASRTSSRDPGSRREAPVIRATPASRSSSAVGSGDWWNEVSTTASANRQSASAAHEPVDVARAHRGRVGDHPGRAQTSTRSTPGSSRAAAAPAGPHSSVTSAAAATARTAGPASSTSPAPSRRTTSTRLTRTPSDRPPRRAGARTAASRSRRTTGRRGDLLGAGHRGRNQHRRPPRPPARPRRRRRCLRSRRSGAARTPSAAPRRAAMPGRGLRHGQPSSGPCGQTRQTSNGPSRCSTRALTAATAPSVRMPARDAGLVGDHAGRMPAARSRAGRRGRRAPGARGRVGAVGHVVDQGAVPVEQHGREPVVCGHTRSSRRTSSSQTRPRQLLLRVTS